MNTRVIREGQVARLIYTNSIEVDSFYVLQSVAYTLFCGTHFLKDSVEADAIEILGET
jgi:hypothetical protein